MSFLSKLTSSEWSDDFPSEDKYEPPLNTPDSDGSIFFSVKESRNKIIRPRKLQVSERGISIWDEEKRNELEVFPFQKIKTFYYSPDGNFVVITVNSKAGHENIPWKTNKQAQQVKLAVDETIAKLLKKKQNLRKSEPVTLSDAKKISNYSSKKTEESYFQTESEQPFPTVDNSTMNTEFSPNSKRPTSLPVTTGQDDSLFSSQPILINEWNGTITRSRSEEVVKQATNETVIQLKPPPSNSKRKAVKIQSMPDLISFE